VRNFLDDLSTDFLADHNFLSLSDMNNLSDESSQV
jgi:hypothetical protein